MAYKRKFGKRKGYKKPTFKRFKRAVKKAAIKRIVRKEISRQAETKTRQVAVLGQNMWSSIATTNFDLYNIVPVGFQVGAFELAQGTGNGARIGNRIRLKKAWIKGTIIPLGYDATANPLLVPLQVKMVLFYDKQYPNTLPQVAAANNILDFNNSVQGFHNDLVDMWAPFNTDRYSIVATRTFKLGFGDNASTGTGTSGTANYVNNDFKLNCNFSIDYTKHMCKVQSYQDNSLNATTRQLYAMWYCAAANGGQFSAAIRPFNVQYQIECKYEDM